jgi:hypothetical protein
MLMGISKLNVLNLILNGKIPVLVIQGFYENGEVLFYESPALEWIKKNKHNYI